MSDDTQAVVNESQPQEMQWFTDTVDEFQGPVSWTYAEDEPNPNDPTEAPGAQVDTVPAQEQQAQSAGNQTHDWEKRYKDLQSYTDQQKYRMQKEHDDLQKQMADYSGLKALRDTLTQHPQLLSQVEAVLAGNPMPSNTQQQTSMQPPPDFDPMDALNPATPSGQWYQAMLDSKIKSAVGNVESLPQQVISMMEKREQQRMEQEAQRQKEAAMRQEFEQFESTHSNMSPEEKQMFTEFLASGPQQRLSLEHLYGLFGMVRGGQQQQAPPVTAKAVLDSKLRQATTSTPPSVSQIPAGSESPMSDDDVFSQSLMKDGRRKWTIGK